MTERCPDRRIGHLTEPGYRAGNSLQGNLHAKRHGIRWVDNDWLVTQDHHDINTHWPKPRTEGFLPTTDDRRWNRMTWRAVQNLRSPDSFRVRDMRTAFVHAKANDQNVEVEAKFQCSADDCIRLAEIARAVFGDQWKRRVWVKTLTDLTGGYPAAVQRLHGAKVAGFTTLLLLRGTDQRRRRFPAHIDYVRGALLAPINTAPTGAPVSYTFTRAAGAPSSTREHYGHTGKPTGITIHHWGAPGQTHDGVVKYLTRDGATTSAHAVVSAGRVTQLVDYMRAAWHAGSTEGNGKTIGVECRPEMSDGDWRTLVEFCADLEDQFGSLRYYRHSDWKATACPGKYGPRLGELIEAVNAEHARRAGRPAPTTTAARTIHITAFRTAKTNAERRAAAQIIAERGSLKARTFAKAWLAADAAKSKATRALIALEVK